MSNLRWLAAAAALSLVACQAATTNQQDNAAGEAPGQGAADKLARVEMKADTSYLTGEERQVVNLLIQAADLLNPIYLRQVSADNPRLRDEIAKSGNKALLDRFDTFMGPWDEVDNDKPFYGNAPRPVGAGIYPAGLTKEQFDAYLAKHPDEVKALTDPYTVVRRQGDRLVAVPYSQEYKEWLEPAAQKLEQAAAITTNPSLTKFLTLRAKAFRSDDYYDSELAWMDLKDTPIEMVIGPYETYTDNLYGAKTAFEAYVVLRNPKESQALDIYKSHLREMEANLPEDEQYKNFKRGFASPISVGDQIHAGGDSNHGIQSVAFNLPNDERVREAKGAKKVILQNVLGAKYDRILQPMASLVLVPADAANVNRRYMYMETLFHELSHSLGPGSITVNGRKTSVDKELKDVGGGFEEAKADVMGAYNVLFMMDKGVLPATEKPQIRAAYVAGLFRAMRFGDTDAHGRGAAMQYRYLRDKGGIVWDANAKRYRIDPAKLDAGIRDLVGDIIRLQATGDYNGTKAFLAKWAVMDAEAKQVTSQMGHIPVDIHPIYPDHV
ncbi:dipeptidyl-peptidase 3 family protein [Sphingomonas sp. URHD0057]|uniref:dipeptidyl-peptidase 3 family protein n=1 Tax=Sphingomonas sp. URHD0057 TaxID=1380389 RepID=UPI00048C3AC1|nr:DNA mismatch repair protein MutT [Sphingomonas sp. URHD0057]